MKILQNRLFRIALSLAIIGVFAVGSWATLDTVIHATGDHEFCSSCHSHAPIGASYRESLHGGNNDAGWRATCSDCHLPSDNALHYIWAKGVHGVVDPYVEFTRDIYTIDWHANRERREEYVYDSSCLGCHKYLQEQTEDNRRAMRSHRRYFSDPDDYSCVECHEEVGHSRLEYHLEAMGWQKKANE